MSWPRQDELDEVVRTVGQGLFELTIKCARCHNHKFDPTADGKAASLYEFQVWTVVSEDQPSRNVALASAGAIPYASSFALANQSRHFDNLIDGTADRRHAFPWVAGKTGLAWIQVDLAEPAMVDRIVLDRGPSVPVDYKSRVSHADADKGNVQWKTVASSSNRMLREDDSREADQFKIDGLEPATIHSITDKIAEIRKIQKDLTRLAAGPLVYAASFNESPEPTWLLRRGDPMQPTQKLSAAIPAVLGGLNLSLDQPELDRRLALAKHLTRADHPLTARVIVNRIWQYHFGTGLVETPSDFGTMGAAASHPELLDWLASDFVASGKLNLKMGGPGFDFFNQRGVRFVQLFNGAYASGGDINWDGHSKL